MPAQPRARDHGDPMRPGADSWVPPGVGVDGLAAAAVECRGCELWQDATGVVFGKGSPSARVVLVGEQPGDAEDRQGAPFVGPAGRLLDTALDEAGIPVAECYVTNAVKHFRFRWQGQRRLHQTPDAGHVAACRAWLAAEFTVLDPELVITLGATAGKALLGPGFRVTRRRGTLIPWPPESRDGPVEADPGMRRAAYLVPTVHPSSVLRADDRRAAHAELVADLAVAAAALA